MYQYKEPNQRHTIKAGVPQGSIRRPTLFCIYISDISTITNTQTAIYADDTAIYAASWNPTQATKYLQTHINAIVEYM